MKKFIILFFAVIVIALIINVMFISDRISKGKHVYIIRYFDNKNENMTYADSIISQDRNCVKFIGSMFKNEESICAENITISKF